MTKEDKELFTHLVGDMVGTVNSIDEVGHVDEVGQLDSLGHVDLVLHGWHSRINPNRTGHLHIANNTWLIA